MRLVVLGASGRTGKLLVEQAAARGHTVTAVVRDSSKLQPAAGVSVVEADVVNTDALTAVLQGHDAVLSTVSSNNAKTRLIERSTQAVIAAARYRNQAGGHRTIVWRSGQRPTVSASPRRLAARPRQDARRPGGGGEAAQAD